MAISTKVIAAVVSRAVQLSPRPTHHSSAQYISAGTRRSSRSRSCGMRASAPDRGVDADRAADLHAGAFDQVEAAAIGGAGIGLGGRTLHRQRLAFRPSGGK